MTHLPILIAKWDEKHRPTTLCCSRCDWSREATVDECGYAEPMYMDDAHCRHCGNGLEWKYAEGDACRGCGKLDFSHPRELKGCCSRRCLLQAEYAAALAANEPPNEASRPAATETAGNTKET